MDKEMDKGVQDFLDKLAGIERIIEERPELAPCKMDLIFLQAQADRVCPMGGIRSYIGLLVAEDFKRFQERTSLADRMTTEEIAVPASLIQNGPNGYQNEDTE